MNGWLAVLPTAVAMGAALVLPGLFWLRAVVRSAVVAAAAAPAVSVGVVILLGVGFDAAGWRWAGSTALPALAAVGACGAAVWAATRGARGGASEPPPRPPLQADVPAAHAYRILRPFDRRVLVATACIGWAVAASPLLASARAADPVQQWDPAFHMNGVWGIVRSGHAQLLGGLGHLYGADGAVAYPIGWHAFFTALFATQATVVQASNASTLAFMGVWVWGCAALTAVVTTSRVATLAAPVLAGAGLSMPADALTMYSQWPRAASVAVLPGVVAATVLLGRRLARAGRGPASGAPPSPFGTLGLAALVALAVGGLGATHPSGLFALVAVLIAPLLAGLTGAARRAVAMRRPAVAALAVAGSLAAALTPLAVLASPPLRSMGSYPRHGISWTAALTHAVTPFPPFERTPALAVTVAVQALLVAAGIWSLLRARRTWRHVVARRLAPDPARDLGARHLALRRDVGPRPRTWPIAAFGVLACLTALAYGPDNAARTFLTAPWHLDPRRIMAVQNMTQVPLAALGFDWLVCFLRAHRVRREGDWEASGLGRIASLAAVFLVAVTLGGAMDARAWAVRHVMDPDELGRPAMASAGELAMLRRLPSELPAGAVVLGDPANGSVYVEAIGQRRAYFPQLSFANRDGAAQKVLAQSFRDIHSDPRVCRVLRAEGIRYFYEDADGWSYTQPRSARAPGLHNVDVFDGFRLVDQGGSARIYRIVACDDRAG